MSENNPRSYSNRRTVLKLIGGTGAAVPFIKTANAQESGQSVPNTDREVDFVHLLLAGEFTAKNSDSIAPTERLVDHFSPYGISDGMFVSEEQNAEDNLDFDSYNIGFQNTPGYEFEQPSEKVLNSSTSIVTGWTEDLRPTRSAVLKNSAKLGRLKVNELADNTLEVSYRGSSTQVEANERGEITKEIPSVKVRTDFSNNNAEHAHASLKLKLKVANYGSLGFHKLGY